MTFILLRLFLLVLPVALYFAWWRWARRHEREHPGKTPWGALALAGLFLVVLSLFGASLFEGGQPGTKYVPTEVDDQGSTVPGGFRE